MVSVDMIKLQAEAINRNHIALRKLNKEKAIGGNPRLISHYEDEIEAYTELIPLIDDVVSAEKKLAQTKFRPGTTFKIT